MPLEKQCCLGSAGTFHSKQYLDMHSKIKNKTPNRSTKYRYQQRQTGSRDGEREQKRAKRNQALRCWEQGHACKRQCHAQCHANLAKEGHVKPAVRWLEERRVLATSTSATAGTGHSHQGNPHSVRKGEHSDISSAWSCKQSHGTMQRRVETKDKRHGRAQG